MVHPSHLQRVIIDEDRITTTQSPFLQAPRHKLLLGTPASQLQSPKKSRVGTNCTGGEPNIVLGGAVVGANVAVHLGEEAQHPELLKTPPHRANKAAGAYNALDTTLAELSEQRVQLTNPSATAEGSEREPAERLELRSCVHLGQARELATFRQIGRAHV